MKAIETSYIAVGWSTWFVLFPVYFIYYGPQFVTLASVFFIILTCALWRCTCSHDPYGLYNCSLALYKSSILFIKVNMLFLWVSFLIINYFIKVNMLFILAHIFYIIFHKLYIAFLATARLLIYLIGPICSCSGSRVLFVFLLMLCTVHMFLNNFPQVHKHVPCPSLQWCQSSL